MESKEEMVSGNLLERAKALDETLKGKKVKHSEKGTYYYITGISFFCCSSTPIMEGRLVVEYTDGVYPYSRFFNEFFGLNDNLEQRFTIIDGSSEGETK